MGFESSETIREYCPFCETETDVLYETLDDESGKMCTECENDLMIPEITEGDPFVMGGSVYTMHFGSDDEMSIERYDEK
jgi:hypothetical protein